MSDPKNAPPAPGRRLNRRRRPLLFVLLLVLFYYSYLRPSRPTEARPKLKRTSPHRRFGF